MKKKLQLMTQIIINLHNESESEWVLELLNRLHLSYQIENDSAKRERAKEIIMRGADTLATEPMLEAIKESQQDRKLPFDNL